MKIQEAYHDTLEAMNYIQTQLDAVNIDGNESYVRKDGRKIGPEDVMALRKVGRDANQTFRLVNEGLALVRIVKSAQ